LSVTGGEIAIDLNAVVENPKISAIEIVAASGSPAPTGDTTAPTVSITAPQAAQLVSGTITAGAVAADNVGVAGVQFLIDGAAYGSELTAAPYSIAVNTTGLANGSHTVAARARDAAGNTATSSSVTFSVSNSVPVSGFTPIRVNAGGPAYTDNAGQVWSADTGYLNGYAYTTGSGIGSTAASPLYQSERWNAGPLQYRFTVPNGTYTVRLKFAEIYFTGPGQRIFNVVVNGQVFDASFDPFAAAGAAYTAVDRSYTVSVTGGQVAIDLNPVVQNPKISAIEILASGDAPAPAPLPGFTTIRVNAGGAAYTDSAGQVWSADTGFIGGYVFSTSNAIANTTAAPLYQTERFNNGTLQYRFGVPNGNYNVTLKFAEVYYGVAGQRVFNIVLNTQAVAPNFDIVAAAGAPNRAVDRTYPVAVANGQIAIDLVPVQLSPKISAIEITAAR
jgi:hypothetical protein